MIIELTGNKSKLEAFIDLLDGYGFWKLPEQVLQDFPEVLRYLLSFRGGR